MRIHVTNDDGAGAPGIAVLAAAVRDAGHDVTIVAPATDYSGHGAAVGPLHATGRVAYARATEVGLPVFAVDGPPALCVLCSVLGGFGPAPDIVLSGINAGANTGRAVLHSGTVGAALTAAQLGVPAMAVSLALDGEWHWETAADIAVGLIEAVAGRGPGSVANLNVPNVDAPLVRGIAPATLAVRGTVQAVFGEPAEGTLQLRFEPSVGRPGPDTDEARLADGWATLSVLSGPRAAPLSEAAALLDAVASPGAVAAC